MKKFIIFIFISLFVSCNGICDYGIERDEFENQSSRKDMTEITSQEENSDKSTTSDENSNENVSKETTNKNTSEENSDIPFTFSNSTLLINTTSSGIFDTILCDFKGMKEVKNLIVNGKMDARDFNYIKWNLTNVEFIDFSNVIIEPYYGIYGTNEGYEYQYNANSIPLGAFFYWCGHDFRDFPEECYDEGMHSIKKVILPTTLKRIERNAFARNYNLTEIIIPEGVTDIDYVSFRYCVSLKTIKLPSTTQNIGRWAFTEMNALDSVYCYATVPPSTIESFGGIDDEEGARGWVTAGTYNGKIKATLCVPLNSVNDYINSKWGTYFEEIKSF